MTVVLSVHDVRDHVRLACLSDVRGPGQPSSALLGRIFHEVAAGLVSADPEKNAFSFFENMDFDTQVWRSQLVPHAYDMLLGPRLARDQARLQALSSGVLHLWNAIRSLCGWLADLAWAARNPEGHKRSLSWNDLRQAVRAEVPLEAEICVPGWAEPVRLTGVADSLLRVPRTGSWCVQEYKLGLTSPEADLCQICLYHLILSQKTRPGKAARGRSPDRGLALVSFQPEVKERLYRAEEIAQVQEMLLALIGRLAGVAERRDPLRGRAQGEGHGTKGELCRQVVDVLREYGRPVDQAGDPISGPAFFRFPVNLGRKVKLEQVQRLGREIQVRLGLEKRPFIGVDHGRVVIDIQRPDRQIIRFADVEFQLPKADSLTGSTQVPIGIDLDGTLRTADLDDPVNAHLLVAGTTGSGKTEWLRLAIHGLIGRNTPRTLRLVLIDPKRVAFNEFMSSQYLLTPECLVYPDTQSALQVLKDLVSEMDRRYLLLHEAGVDHLSSYVRSTGHVLPRIVCVCDEYYALIAGDLKRRKETEAQIGLLGAKARAAGIHLILATQQPSREVIKGALDANIPGRVGLMMVKGEESKMLLGQTGAENLLGKGDLLFKDVGDPVRLQAPLV
ncbi:MAG: FtsK/SpoIIIE domain-containing protein [Thermodesulfobacteriota bacterium]